MGKTQSFNASETSSTDSISNNSKNSNTKFSLKDSDGNNLTRNQQKFFEDCKLLDEEGNLKVMYHGTARADRVGYYFNPDRATSGPMAYFTDDEDIATNYSKSKKDTSLDYDDNYNDYYTQFRIDIDGKDMSVSEAWNKLSYSKRMEIKEKAPHIVFDDDYENIIYDETAQYGLGNIDAYTINMHRGNMLEVLTDSWLESGELWNQESRFLEALKMAGLDDVRYMDPDFKDERVYKVYLNITNPLDTSNIPEELVNKLENAIDTVEYTEGNSADLWDKNNVTPEQWMQGLRSDLENNTTYSWTRIPDWVTNILKEAGYDGIIDKGGKFSSVSHTVAIPFYSNQIKSVDNKNPTEDVDIRFSLKDVTSIQELAEHIKNEDEGYEYGKSFSIGVTPSIYSELFGIPELNLVLNTSHTWDNLSSREDAENANREKDIEYHNINPKVFAQKLAKIENPTEIYWYTKVLDNPRITVNLGNNWVASIQFYSNKSTSDASDRSNNCIVTVFKADEGYFESEHLKLIYKKEDSVQTEDTPQTLVAVVNESNLLEDNLTEFLDFVKEYEASHNIKNDRIEFEAKRNKIKNNSNTKLSLKDDSTLESENKQLIKDNEHYKKLVDNLKAQFRLTKGHRIGSKGIGDIARWLKTEFNSNVNITELRKDLNTYFNMVYANGNDIENSDVVRMGENIIRSVIEQSKDNGAISEYGRQILNEVKKTKIKLSDAQVSEIQARTGTSVNEWRKSNFGRINVSNDGILLESMWKQWSELYPDVFDENISEADMLNDAPFLVGHSTTIFSIYL